MATAGPLQNTQVPPHRWGAAQFVNLFGPWVILFPIVGPAIWSASRGRRNIVTVAWAAACTGALILAAALLAVPRNERGDIPQAVGTTWALIGGFLFLSAWALRKILWADRAGFRRSDPSHAN